MFHSDIKLENLIVSKDTLQVRLIDFGSGELLRKSAYTTLYGIYYSSKLKEKRVW